MSIELGIKGEALASQYLKTLGHEILHLNFRALGKEIDIVSQVDGLLVFTEVKTRRSARFSQPECAVSKHKQQHIYTAAQEYLEATSLNTAHRFDVISIIHNDTEHRIKHFKEAFIPGIL